MTFEGNFPIMLLLYLLMMCESRELLYLLMMGESWKQKNNAASIHNLNQTQFSAWEPYFMEVVEFQR